jgi:purine nucleosidase
MKKIVFFDTDPGIDDAMEILFAQASGKINLLGITTVFGNASVTPCVKANVTADSVTA